MIGYGPASQAIRAERGLPYATGADDPDVRHPPVPVTEPATAARPEVKGMTTITVTAGHIANGKRHSWLSCPVALAIRDALPDVSVVQVRRKRLTLGDTPRLVELDLPGAALNFIGDFDDGAAGEPFTFELDYPAEVAA